EDPAIQVVCIPIADGGEGTVDAIVRATGGQRKSVRVHGPCGEMLDTAYGWLPDGSAVVETAMAAGLPLMGTNLDVMNASTFGVGELIGEAVRHGARRVYLGLGGSATNDGGCGVAAALGVRFTDRDGRAFVPVGRTLREIEHIDMSGSLLRQETVELLAMCDVTNPLCGPMGAAAVYAPQKGADEAMVQALDEGLSHLADVILRDLGTDIRDTPGSGAAGGMGAGAVALLGGRLNSGIHTVLDAVGFRQSLADASLVLTGEGRMDAQSAYGKVISGILQVTRAQGVPVIAICGGIQGDVGALYEQGLTAAFSINRVPMAFAEAKPHSADNLYET
ncbi:glycerate kinase, partial [Candidatus Falkowbacteria bacterium]|nr:glycerate kinase [Candidatus Falkowbacteria bacterium]